MTAPTPPEMGVNWWKVSLDKDGTILGCEQVDEAARGSKLICYIQATSKVDAVCKKYSARIYAQHKDAGQCTRSPCKNPARPGRVTCAGCAHAINVQCAQRRARRKGGDLTDRRKTSTPEARREAELETKRRWRKDKITLFGHIVLREFDARGPEGFRAWLVEQIEASKT
jgi:hypothetical protein